MPNTLYGVNTSPENVQLIKANHKVDGKYIIPPSHYRFGKEGLYSYLLAIKYEGDSFGIVIPAIEVIRFYYAVSTHLSHAVFSSAFKHDLHSLINPEKSGFIEEES